MLQQTISEHLFDTGQYHHFRAEFLASDWAKTTTLTDILDDPGAAFRSLSTQRGMGAVSIGRLRQSLARVFASEFSQHWEEAKEALEEQTDPQGLRAQRLAAFISEWGVTSDNFTFTGRYYPANALRVRKMYRALAEGADYVLACDTLPALVKTRAVLDAESGFDHYAHRLSDKLRSVLKEYAGVKLRGLTLIDTYMLSDLLNGERYYRTLPDSARTTQFFALRRFYDAEPYQDAFVVDFHAVGLSPAWVWGDGPLLRHSFGGFIEVTSPDLVELFRARANTARMQGQSLQDWMKAHRDHPVIKALDELPDA